MAINEHVSERSICSRENGHATFHCVASTKGLVMNCALYSAAFTAAVPKYMRSIVETDRCLD